MFKTIPTAFTQVSLEGSMAQPALGSSSPPPPWILVQYNRPQNGWRPVPFAPDIPNITFPFFGPPIKLNKSDQTIFLGNFHAAPLKLNSGAWLPSSMVGRYPTSSKPACPKRKRRLWLSKLMGSHFGLGEFTTHFSRRFSGWIGMFTGGTI